MLKFINSYGKGVHSVVQSSKHNIIHSSLEIGMSAMVSISKHDQKVDL